VRRGLRIAWLLALGVGAISVVMHRDLINTGMIETWLHGFGVWAPVGVIQLYAVGTHKGQTI
jgi:hypothetical protein